MKRDELRREITKLVSDNYFNEFKLCSELEDEEDDIIIKIDNYESTSIYIIEDINELEDKGGIINIEDINLPLPDVDKKDMCLDFICWKLERGILYIEYQLSTIVDK